MDTKKLDTPLPKQEYFELANSGQLTDHKLNAALVESKREAGVHHAVSFTAQNTYVGLPQMKAYNSINIRCVFGSTFSSQNYLRNP